MTFTAAQKKALLGLPADGSWVTKIGRLSKAVDSLRLYHKGTVEHEYGEHGPRGGWCGRWRLTEIGRKFAAIVRAEGR